MRLRRYAEISVCLATTLFCDAAISQTHPGGIDSPGVAVSLPNPIDTGSEPTAGSLLIPDCEPYYTFYGEGAGDQFGFPVQNAGDVDGDGTDDILIGAPFNDQAGHDAGKVYIYSGVNGTLVYSFAGEDPDDWFGSSAASAGDLNGDGYADIVIASRLNDANGFNSGRVYVFSGQTGDTMYVFTGIPGEELGSSVASAGDVNNDGYDDLIMGAWANSTNGTYAGQVYVVSGPTGDTLHIFTGDSSTPPPWATPGGWFGSAVSSAGDFDGDGFDDLLVGAVNYYRHLSCWEIFGTDFCNFYWGTAHIYSGRTAERLLEMYETKTVMEPNFPTWDRFGASVATAGDVGNDGLADVIIGAPGGQETDVGASFVYEGENSPGQVWRISGAAPSDHLGLGVSSAGDVDGDGYDDIMVGAWGNGEGGVRAGKVYVYSGRTRDTAFTLIGGPGSDWLGASVSSIGDVNGDGFGDLLIGSPGHDLNGENSGRAELYLGGWVCGDANGDQLLTTADVEFLLTYYFDCGDLSCLWRMSDLNCNGRIDLADVEYLAAYVNGTGPAPCCAE